MLAIDWWTWKCARCGWEVVSERTVNFQQAIAEALIRVHIKTHDEAPSAHDAAAKR